MFLVETIDTSFKVDAGYFIIGEGNTGIFFYKFQTPEAVAFVPLHALISIVAEDNYEERECDCTCGDDDDDDDDDDECPCGGGDHGLLAKAVKEAFDTPPPPRLADSEAVRQAMEVAAATWPEYANPEDR